MLSTILEHSIKRAYAEATMPNSLRTIVGKFSRVIDKIVPIATGWVIDFDNMVSTLRFYDSVKLQAAYYLGKDPRDSGLPQIIVHTKNLGTEAEVGSRQTKVEAKQRPPHKKPPQGFQSERALGEWLLFSSKANDKMSDSSEMDFAMRIISAEGDKWYDVLFTATDPTSVTLGARFGSGKWHGDAYVYEIRDAVTGKVIPKSELGEDDQYSDYDDVVSEIGDWLVYENYPDRS